MTLLLNERALERADRLAADAEAARVDVTALSNGTRVIDCGAEAAGGFEAGRCLAEVCMAGLGSVAYAPLVFEGRWLPALTVTTDRPAVACLAAQYAGWRIDRDGYFAMGSGPGRALIRAGEVYADLARGGGALRRPRRGRGGARPPPGPRAARPAAGRGRRVRGGACRRAAHGADA